MRFGRRTLSCVRAHLRNSNNTLIIIVALRSGVCKVTAHRAVVNVGGLWKYQRHHFVSTRAAFNLPPRARTRIYSRPVRCSLWWLALINGILREMPAATPKLGPICLADEGDGFNWTDGMLKGLH